jgi:hypothetical protein
MISAVQSGDFNVTDTDHGEPPEKYYELLKPGETVDTKRCQFEPFAA